MTDLSSQIVHSKILQVMSNLDDIPKLGRNDWHNYNYMQADDVFRAIREQLVNVGLTVTQEVIGADIIEGQWLVSYKFKVTCTETGELDTFTWAASTPVMVGKEGETVDDKALPKCHTIAKKYAMIHLVFASAGDTDADNQPNPGRPKHQRQHRPKADAGSKPRPASNGPATGELATKRQQGKIKAMFGEMYDDQAQEAWHYAIQTMTDGRTNSTRQITKTEASQLIECLNAEAAGRDVLGDMWDGDVRKEYVSDVSGGATNNLWALTRPQAEALARRLNTHNDRAAMEAAQAALNDDDTRRL